MIEYDRDWTDTGDGMLDLMKRFYPICRSITGNGVRETLKIIREHVPIEINEIPSGTKVFDWTVPKEWNINDAYIKNSKGEKIIDYKKSNLHVLNYSTPINKKMSLKELKPHLFTLPDYPNWIPYLTSYYNENWGFCLTHNQFENFVEDEVYEVFIDSTLENGYLTYGEFYIEGEHKEEFLISTYICHPSLCNDNLSGLVLSTFLAKNLLKFKEKSGLKYSYRFLFIPETIGAICWLNMNEDILSNIRYGLIPTCVGDASNSTYKRTKNGDAIIDKVVEKVLMDSKDPYEIIDFFPSGSDERQFCSPGFNLPIGSLMRTIYGKFPEYHTSADNLEFIKAESLSDSFKKYMNAIFIIENNKIYLNLNPKCEPHLSKRGLYSTIGGKKTDDDDRKAMFWILNLSDGKNPLLQISIRSKLNFGVVKKIADMLEINDLIIYFKEKSN